MNYVLKSGHERETKQSRQIGKLGRKLAVMTAEYGAVTASLLLVTRQDVDEPVSGVTDSSDELRDVVVVAALF
jgi:hypothetical protein